MLITIGFGIASGVWWLALIAIIFFASIYWPVINVETVELEKFMGDEYREYAGEGGRDEMSHESSPYFNHSLVPADWAVL